MKIIRIIVAVFAFFLFVNHAQANDDVFGEKDKAYLLNIARQTLISYLRDGELPEIDGKNISKSLLLKRACFVTLHKKGYGLRGCIGLFERNRPIYKNVMNRAMAAAVRDIRFPTVKYEELKDIKIDISILTVPEKLAFTSPDELIEKLRPMVDGVILETRYGGSTYLPQVWEQLPDKKEFLSHLCTKHGAPSNTWKNDFKNIKVSTYQAIVFSEKNYGGSRGK